MNNKKTITLLAGMLLLTLTATAQVTTPSRVEGMFMRSSFTQGTDIVVADDFADELEATLPIQWKATRGAIEVGNVGGIPCLRFANQTTAELVNQPQLAEQCTFEMDFFCPADGLDFQHSIGAENAQWGHSFQLNLSTNEYHLVYRTPDDMGRSSMGQLPIQFFQVGNWNHLAISYDRHRLVAYINGKQIFEVSDCKQPSTLWLSHDEWNTFHNANANAVTNIVVCNGIEPLEMQMERSSFTTRSIAFAGDTLLAPISMTVITRLRNVMRQQTNMKLTVECHADLTMSDSVALELTQRQANAIVERLVAMGIEAERLEAKGMGNANPLANGKTPADRTRNRRVVFIKQ